MFKKTGMGDHARKISNRVNPNGGNGTMVVTLLGIKPRHAGRVEEAAFRHGKAGVGHIFYNPAMVAVDGNTRVWRNPSAGDPGQPKGWLDLVPLDLGGLADHIRVLVRLGAASKKSGNLVQALVFQSVEEGLAFQAEMLSPLKGASGEKEGEQ